MNGIPGANAMGDTLEFVKNLWGSMKIPGMAMPSMSPEEIDKQIADLKAVESWLQMNMNMLRGSIQALEVQSATLSALRSMSETFAQAAAGTVPTDDKPTFESPFGAAKAGVDEPEATEAKADPAGMAAPFANPAVWWNAMQDQFQQAVSQAVAPASKPARKSAKSAKPGTAKKKPAASAGADGSSRRKRRKPGEAA
jgi:hypothetical protein